MTEDGFPVVKVTLIASIAFVILIAVIFIGAGYQTHSNNQRQTRIQVACINQGRTMVSGVCVQTGTGGR